MTTSPKYPKRPHETGSLILSLLVAGIMFAIILFFTQ
jgi:hypothetical protein